MDWFLTRWKQCASIVNDGFGYALAYLYVQHHNASSSVEMGSGGMGKVKEMIHYLKMAYERVIQEQTWIPNYFKPNLIQKVSLVNSRTFQESK